MSGLCSYSRRRGSCGKVGIPRCWRDFQAWWESPLLDFSTTCLFHSLGRGANFRDGTSLAGVMPQPSGPVSHAESSVQVLVEGDRASRRCASPTHLVDLQDEVLKADGVITSHSALKLEREDQIQVLPRAGHKGRATLSRRDLEALVELADIALAEEAIGGRDRGDGFQAQLLGQPSLPGAKAAFRTTPSLRRVRRNHLHA